MESLAGSRRILVTKANILTFLLIETRSLVSAVARILLDGSASKKRTRWSLPDAARLVTNILTGIKVLSPGDNVIATLFLLIKLSVDGIFTSTSPETETLRLLTILTVRSIRSSFDAFTVDTEGWNTSSESCA